MASEPNRTYQNLAYDAYEAENQRRIEKNDPKEPPFSCFEHYQAYLVGKKSHYHNEPWVHKIPSLKPFPHEDVRRAIDPRKTKWVARVEGERRAAAEAAAAENVDDNNMDMDMQEVDVDSPIVDKKKAAATPKPINMPPTPSTRRSVAPPTSNRRPLTSISIYQNLGNLNLENVLDDAEDEFSLISNVSSLVSLKP